MEDGRKFEIFQHPSVSHDQSTESPSSVSNGEKAEKLSNVISHWKQENAVSMAHKLSTHEQLVHSTPWMKQFVLEIVPYPRFCKEIEGSLYLLAQICPDPLHEV